MRGNSWGGRRDRKTTLLVVSAVAIVALTAGLIVSLMTRPKTKIEVVAPPPEGMSLSQRAGVNSLLGVFSTTDTRRTGTLTVLGAPLSIDMYQSADNRTGRGTIVAGRVTGQAVVLDGRIFMRGVREFWTAIGAGSVTLDNAWIAVPPDFLDGKAFYPAATVVKLFSGPDAKLTGDTVVAGENKAVLNASSGISHLTIPGYDVEVATVPSAAFLPQPDDPDLSKPLPSLVKLGGAWQIAPPAAPPAPPPPGQPGG